MQEPQGKIKLAEMRLPEIRTYIYETVGKEIETFGYKFRKSDFTFKKKQGKNFVQFVFVFHDYNPIKYDTSFGIGVFNNAIQEIKSKITFNNLFDSTDWISLLIQLGDFIESEKAKEINWRSAYQYNLVSGKDLFNAANEVSGLLKKEILPLCEALFSPEGIDSLFASRGVWWTVSSRNINNLMSDLISAKLGGKRDYHQVYSQIVAEIKPYLEKGWIDSSTLTAIEDVYRYLKEH